MKSCWFSWEVLLRSHKIKYQNKKCKKVEPLPFMHLLNGMFYKIIKIRCQQIWTKPQYHMMEVLRLLTYHYSFRNFSESILCSRWERFVGQNLIYSRKGRQHIQQSDQVLKEKKSSTKHFNSGGRECLMLFQKYQKRYWKQLSSNYWSRDGGI